VCMCMKHQSLICWWLKSFKEKMGGQQAGLLLR
jgi:hypothetical protein